MAACPYSSGALGHPGGTELTVHALTQAGLSSGARLLDLGCGEGESVGLLRRLGYTVEGLDADLGHASQGIQHSDAALGLPYDDAAFDGVLAECSLSLMENQTGVIRECARVLRPGGCIMISDLYARNPGGIAAVRTAGGCTQGIFLREELVTQLQQAGFEEIRFEDHSRELCSAMARFIFEHGPVEELWNCSDSAEGAKLAAAMKLARAGYFLCLAVRMKSGRRMVGGSYGG